MALYLVTHTHTPEACPLDNADMIKMLGEWTSQGNASRLGVKILGDAVDVPGHSLTFILEADDLDKVLKFLRPFVKLGQHQVTPVITCQEVSQYVPGMF